MTRPNFIEVNHNSSFFIFNHVLAISPSNVIHSSWCLLHSEYMMIFVPTVTLMGGTSASHVQLLGPYTIELVLVGSQTVVKFKWVIYTFVVIFFPLIL